MRLLKKTQSFASKQSSSVAAKDELDHSAHSDGSGGWQNSNGSESGLQLATSETRAVKYARLAVVSFLIISASLVSVAVYFYTSRSEISDFEDTFENGATRIQGAFLEYLDNKFMAISSFGAAVTAKGLETNATWPFVTVPHFEARGENTLILSNSTFMYFAPLVPEDQREAWEEYTAEYGIQWIRESFEYRSNSESRTSRRDLKGESLGFSKKNRLSAPWELHEESPPTSRDLQELGFTNGIPNRIFRLTQDGESVVDESPGPYSPLWQMTPTVPSLWVVINYNEFSSALFGSGLPTMVETQHAVISEVWNSGASEDKKGEGAVLREFVKSENPHYGGDPLSILKYPVFDRFGDDRKLVGGLTLDIHWLSFLNGVLPPQADGFICVLKNTYGQTFTYEINGQVATYIGEGDLHDPGFDSMERVVDLSSSVLHTNNEFVTTYNDAELDRDYCRFSLYIYPSDTLESKYISKMPLIYTVGVIVTFLFTTVIILAYDCIVERRQRITMESAVRSDMIVSSLFPKAFRDRLYQEEEDNSGELSDIGITPTPPRRRTSINAGGLPLPIPRLQISKFLTDGANSSTEKDEMASAKPIADLFPETTVFFADLAGFTAWSSSREPAAVFHLLETIYGGFDEIARKRGVFKVETIGDCYVAVTGLPDPDPHHAVHMARFARDCLLEMDRLVAKLAPKLGEDTLNLAMRVGIHSGPVTAGVLRGERFRFQLFGDTVNVAAKMENKGQRKRIHASKETAALLRDAGKSHWLKPRDDDCPIMYTFWVEPMSLPNPENFSSTAGSERSFTDCTSGVLEDSFS